MICHYLARQSYSIYDDTYFSWIRANFFMPSKLVQSKRHFFPFSLC
uniref:Uncharacterized protein n=1 Tax=Arundo donax TaxID=35708 RepID=A0A0A9G328_ARUDO